MPTKTTKKSSKVKKPPTGAPGSESDIQKPALEKPEPAAAEVKAQTDDQDSQAVSIPPDLAAKVQAELDKIKVEKTVRYLELTRRNFKIL